MTHPLKELAEFIRLGAMLRPQCRLVLFYNGGSCAVGAAIEARTGIDNLFGNVEDAQKDLHKDYALSRRLSCPACHVQATLYEVIGSHLNDTHNWTREAVAGFLETLEPLELPAPVLVAGEAIEQIRTTV